VKRPVLIAGGVAAALVVLALAGSYAYFFSGLRSAPKPLSLTSRTQSPAARSGGTLAGTWSAGSGSLARYRVKEVFAGQTAAHEAVAETSSVSGTIAVRDTSGGGAMTDLQVTSQLTDLHSADSVAGLSVSRRDRIVQGSLSTSQFPNATFVARNVQLPASLAGGSTVKLTVPGQLTIHGVTRTEQVTVQVRVAGATADAAGQTSFDMTDFAVQPPQVPITTVQPQVTLEFQLNLAKS
jgi:hypothetical protein